MSLLSELQKRISSAHGIRDHGSIRKPSKDPEILKPLNYEDMTLEQKARFEQAKALPVTSKINHGDLDEVGLNEIKNLFKILDMDGNGDLDFQEIRMFLHDIMDPPCPDAAVIELFELAKHASGGKIGSAYFHSALTTGPLRRLVHDVQRQAAVATKDNDASQAPVSRQFMLERFEWRVSRDESFRTLPFSMVYLSVFVGLVILHLRIWERQQVERAMENHIAGWGYEYIGPYLQDHLPNLDNAYIWAERSGLQVVLGYCAADAHKSVPARFCEMAPRNILVSDLMLFQEVDQGEPKARWLLNSAEAKAYLQANPSEYYQAGLAELARLKSSYWFDKDTVTFEMHFVTYNENVRMFSLNEVLTRFDSSGFATHSAYTWAIPAESYNRMFIPIAFDGLFVLLLLIPFKNEFLEVLRSFKLGGCKGFKEYWGLWNVVDWTMIVNGIAIVQIWLQLCYAIESDNIQGLLDDDYKLTSKVMELEVDVLEKLRDALKIVLLLYRVLHIVMALNTIAILMKFFKAFQANARLQVVTKSLALAASDLFHFMVVFYAVFNGFVVTGHILLGGDMVHFNSFAASTNTCFLCLMGDFGWYSDLTMEVEPLASGLPYTVVSLWFWSFMITALLILLNMLLAIILENYAVVVEELNKMPDAPTLIQQGVRYYHRWQTARQGGFSPLVHFLEALQDPKAETHPDEMVTLDTLQKAFPNMKFEQAEFLMKWLQKDANARAAKEADDEVMLRLKKCQSMIQTIAENLHNVSITVMRCDCRLEALEEAEVQDPAPQLAEPAAEPVVDARKGITDQLQEQQKVMKDLCDQLAVQQRSSASMSRALAELSQLMPREAAGGPELRQGQPFALPACCGTATGTQISAPRYMPSAPSR